MAFEGIKAALLENASYNTLVGGRIYPDVVPKGLTPAQAYPCGVLAYGGISQAACGAQYSSTIAIINNDRIGVWLTISHRAIGTGEHLNKLDEIAAEADKTLHKMIERAVTGGKILACVFRNVIEYSAPNEAGVQMFFNGAFYEVLVQKT